jgi:hypothetical protein
MKADVWNMLEQLWCTTPSGTRHIAAILRARRM